MSEPDHDDSQPSSDELDEDYHYAQMVTPPRPRSSRPILYATPRHRADRTVSLSTAAKHAVVSKSRTPERCFMTLENAPRSAIEVCHFIPKATKASELLALEYNIGLPARTLNVNTVQNLDFLRADLHKSFDRNDWILIPSTDVLSRIEQRIQSFVQERDGGAETSSDIYDEFAYAPPDWKEYRVMYLNLREDITVIRQRWSPSSPSTSGSRPDSPQPSIPQPPPPSYDFYRAPFADFPIIQSHVHPFCVIFNAGQKLHHKPYFTPPSHIDRSDLQIVRRLYDQFTAPPPPTWGRDVPIVPREPPGDEGGSRRRSWHKDDPGPSTRKRRAFVEASRAITQTAHTTDKTGHDRRNGEHSSKRMRTPDISTATLTPERDSIAFTDNLVPCGDCGDYDHLPQGLEDWADGVSTRGEDNALLLNDHQIGSYVREQARRPLKYPWHSWRVDWGHTPEPDTSRFSSNDWAFWMRTRYLTL